MKVKVLEVLGRLQDGGAETLVKDYALMVDKSLADIIVVPFMINPNSANFKLLKKNNVKIRPLFSKWNKASRLFRRFLGEWLIPKKLDAIVKEESPDVIHIHLANIHYFMPIRESLSGIKILYTCHNLPTLMFSDKRKKEMDAARYFIQKNNMQLIALHDGMAAELNRMFGINNTIVIRNGIDLPRFQNVRESKKELRLIYKIPKDAFVIGHVGRFSYQKNHEFLIKIFTQIMKQNVNAFLLLIGNGELKESIQSELNSLKLQDRYLILSNRDDIPQLMHSMDVFVFPSRFEGLGIVLIEAQASGLPCVVSDNVPKDAFVTDYIHPLSLNESLDNWCKEILNSPAKEKNIVRLEEYDMHSEIHKLEKVYIKK